MKQTLVFDFDGTIGDSFAVAEEVFYELTGHPRLSRETIRQFRRMPILKVIKELGLKPWQVPGLVVRGRAAMSRHIKEVQPFAGMPQALRQLHADGYRMYILSSNSTQNIEIFLQAQNLSECFVKIYGGVGIVGKTSAIKRVLRQNKLTPANCLYIGDEVRDVEAAKKADIAVLSVAWGYNDRPLLEAHAPTAVADSPGHMVNLIREL